MRGAFTKFDMREIRAFETIHMPLARVAIFVVFFWFGLLKLFGQSPANGLVQQLLEHTLPFINFQQFIVFFGILEMVIGVVFLIPRLERVAIVLLIPHMFTTFLPLVLLPGVTWQAPFVPTLEGQYIIKNLIIIALSISIVVHRHNARVQS